MKWYTMMHCFLFVDLTNYFESNTDLWHWFKHTFSLIRTNSWSEKNLGQILSELKHFQQPMNGSESTTDLSHEVQTQFSFPVCGKKQPVIKSCVISSITNKHISTPTPIASADSKGVIPSRENEMCQLPLALRWRLLLNRLHCTWSGLRLRGWESHTLWEWRTRGHLLLQLSISPPKFPVCWTNQNREHCTKTHLIWNKDTSFKRAKHCHTSQSTFCLTNLLDCEVRPHSLTRSTLCQRRSYLWGKFYLQLATQILSFEFGIFSNIRRDHSLDLKWQNRFAWVLWIFCEYFLLQRAKQFACPCLTCFVFNSKPSPKSSTPALLLTTVRSFTPLLRRPLIKFSGMPQSPNPAVITTQSLTRLSSRMSAACRAHRRYTTSSHTSS